MAKWDKTDDGYVHTNGARLVKTAGPGGKSKWALHFQGKVHDMGPRGTFDRAERVMTQHAGGSEKSADHDHARALSSKAFELGGKARVQKTHEAFKAAHEAHVAAAAAHRARGDIEGEARARAHDKAAKSHERAGRMAEKKGKAATEKAEAASKHAHANSSVGTHLAAAEAHGAAFEHHAGTRQGGDHLAKQQDHLKAAEHELEKNPSGLGHIALDAVKSAAERVNPANPKEVMQGKKPKSLAEVRGEKAAKSGDGGGGEHHAAISKKLNELASAYDKAGRKDVADTHRLAAKDYAKGVPTQDDWGNKRSAAETHNAAIKEHEATAKWNKGRGKNPEAARLHTELAELHRGALKAGGGEGEKAVHGAAVEKHLHEPHVERKYEDVARTLRGVHGELATAHGQRARASGEDNLHERHHTRIERDMLDDALHHAGMSKEEHETNEKHHFWHAQEMRDKSAREHAPHMKEKYDRAAQLHEELAQHHAAAHQGKPLHEVRAAHAEAMKVMHQMKQMGGGKGGVPKRGNINTEHGSISTGKKGGRYYTSKSGVKIYLGSHKV